MYYFYRKSNRGYGICPLYRGCPPFGESVIKGFTVSYKQGGSLCSPPAAHYLDTFHHIAHMHIIKCCNRAVKGQTLKSSKERLKDIDYVNSMRLILQLYSIICCACALISSCLGHVT